MHRGFSLVELSIVLVILGLLVGGILAGQSLIRASELRSVSTELNQHATALNAFRDKYFQLPGDFDKATKFWGKDATNCNSDPATAGTPGACNGDGDGQVGGSNQEYLQLWRHLANAGLVEGSYTAAVSGGANALPGVNSPRSTFTQNTYTFYYLNMTVGDTANLQLNYGNHFDIGGSNTAWGATAPIFKTEESWNLDTKMDDGLPGRGRMTAIYWDTCSTAGSFTDYDGTYALDVATPTCAMRYEFR